MQHTAVILAAGLGTRMKSVLPKALHRIAGRTMLAHLSGTAHAVFDRIVVVTGPEMDAVAREAAPAQVVIQQDRLGTAHAALQAAPLFGDGIVAVLYVDNPLVSEASLRALVARLDQGDAGLVLLGMRPPEPGRYGRIVMEGDRVSRIVEYIDASEAERGIGLCNVGGLCARAKDMRRWLARIGNDNIKGEYYLTDLVAIAAAEGVKVAVHEAPYEECLGVNSRAELAAAEAALQKRLRAAALDAGVTMTAPDTVHLAADTRLAPDVTIGPYVVFGPGVAVETGTEIRAFSHLEGCAIGEGAIIGPYARIRPGTDIGKAVHIGNFVEVKAARLGQGVKANHLTYLGDTEVGEATNIGAGTITCNYDGHAKHRTVIGSHVFIGSDVALVAPVSVGDGASIGAGSVITENVNPDALALARGRQVEKPGRAEALRQARGK
ncbi:MAG TPA: bifunctional UDP-N-acetylglucosamine diphosphorylase/glucosamine-1-phosphate N-acetyltransferase GlmU [Acetobacteraceae bacterium]|nr:bifunctional UDP-N-acetylglucosamine diphosphorylase/glucosamine-1-phosphate N-acetyltransferase GlmU [Acetobacteraceae bacterium]